MSDDWKERKPRETDNAARAFVDYLARVTDPNLPKGEKTLEALWAHYQDAEDAPTKSLDTLKNWSRRHHWQDRVEAHVVETNRKTLAKASSDVAGYRVKRLRLVADALTSIETQIKHGVPVDPKQTKDLVELEAKLLGEPLVGKVELEHGDKPGSARAEFWLRMAQEAPALFEQHLEFVRNGSADGNAPSDDDG